MLKKLYFLDKKFIETEEFNKNKYIILDSVIDKSMKINFIYT